MNLSKTLFLTSLTLMPIPSVSQFSKELFDSFERNKVAEITDRRFNQSDLFRWLKPFEDRGVFEKTVVGKSSEGREIWLMKLGTGKTRVFLWSQMHGDEPTATMALADMVSYFSRNARHPSVSSILQNLTLLVIPMINPDGAARFQRRSVHQIDINRDALRLQTPEASILKDVQQQYKPEFGFNLHDQDARYTVGSSRKVTAIALLAPATDESRSDNDVRKRAKKVAATVRNVLHEFIPGHIAKYDDTFEPRAFGDNIQKWGTSTVLIESGGWPNDRDKMFLRKLNYVALLSALSVIADGTYATADIASYEQLPFNSKNLYDVIIRSVRLKTGDNVASVSVDVAFNVEEKIDSPDGQIRLVARVVDIGDLSTYSCFEEIDGKTSSVDAARIRLDSLVPYSDLRGLLLK